MFFIEIHTYCLQSHLPYIYVTLSFQILPGLFSFIYSGLQADYYEKTGHLSSWGRFRYENLKTGVSVIWVIYLVTHKQNFRRISVYSIQTFSTGVFWLVCHVLVFKDIILNIRGNR